MATYDIKCANEECQYVFEVKMSMMHTEADVKAHKCPVCLTDGGSKTISLNTGGVRVYGDGAYKPSQRY